MSRHIKRNKIGWIRTYQTGSTDFEYIENLPNRSYTIIPRRSLKIRNPLNKKFPKHNGKKAINIIKNIMKQK